MSRAPESKAGRESVVVLVGRLDATGLEERSRAEDAVGAGERQAAVEIAGARERIEMNGRRGIVAKLGAEVFSRGLELGDDSGVSAKPDIQVLEGIVVDEVELNVLIAPAFAGGRVGCAKQVELRAFLFHRLRLGLGRF